MVNKVAIFIQARLFSTRLKGKILFSFFNQTIIDRIIKISKRVKFKKKIYILSGNYKKNSFLKKYALINNVNIFFGDEDNVLKRFQNLIYKEKLQDYYILRLTSDNYLAQPKILDHVIKEGLKKKYDYCYIKPLSHFAGELIKATTLLKEKGKTEDIKNHVTLGIRKNKKIKKLVLGNNTMNIDHTKYFTLDTIDDLMIMKVLEDKYPSLTKLDNLKTLKKVQKENKNFKKFILNL
jgi:spore coat polysaccharide biosynthesis protein SpsF (cytidylyltransferase family)